MFSGASRLNQVLQALDVANVEPVWSLKQTKNKIFLDLVWKTPGNSNLNVPATQVTSVDPRQNQLAQRGVVDNQPIVSSLDVTGNKKRKNKSPSTKRRDRKRYELWKAKKHLNGSHKSQSQLGEDEVNFVNIQTPLEKLPGVGTDNSASGLTTDQRLSFPSNSPSPTASCSEPDGLSDSVLNQPPVTYRDPELDRAARELDALLKREYEKLSLELNLKRPRHPSVNTNITLPDLPNPPNLSSLEPLSASASSNSNNQVELDSDDDADSDVSSGYEHCCNVMCCADEHDIYPNKFMRCTRCSIALYCDRKCQKEHWPLHRTVCGKVFPYSLKKQDLI